MAWLSNRKFRALTDRAAKKFADELNDDAKSKTLALAIGHACYPGGAYGDGSTMDSMLSTIQSVATTPCDSATALMLVKQWETGTLTANEIIGRVWGMEIDPFVARIVKRIKVS